MVSPGSRYNACVWPNISKLITQGKKKEIVKVVFVFINNVIIVFKTFRLIFWIAQKNHRQSETRENIMQNVEKVYNISVHRSPKVSNINFVILK